MTNLKVVHIITSLTVGGAENMLCKLVTRMNRSEFDPMVVSLGEIGPLGERIQQAGIPVHALGMRAGIPDPSAILRLARWLRGARPDVVQTWLYHADFVGSIANRIAGKAPLAWNIRHSHLDPATIKRSTLMLGKLLQRMSARYPQKILCCSKAGMDEHLRLGYPASKMEIIPNGFDLTAFQPDHSAREAIRGALGLPADAPLIGMVGRFHPMKDHRNLARAAGLLAHDRPDVHFMLAGEGLTNANTELIRWLEKAGMRDRFHLLGARTDMPILNAALDIATLSSAYGEGFPNVVGEAMACGVPCVVTDVGDSAYIVGEAGSVVSPRSPGDLCEAWRSMLALPADQKQALGQAARRRVETEFSLDVVVNRYESCYREMANA